MNTKITGYIPALDGLRALSILLVFAGHIGLGNFVPGGLGVTTFFFISGFIITNLLITEYNKSGTIRLKLFYIRRLLRLYPALLLMLLLTTVFVLYLEHSLPWKELIAALFYFENYYFVSGYTHLTFYYKILWSLAVEEHFYLVFPFLLLALARKINVFFMATVTLVVIALLTRVYISYHYHANEYAFVQTYVLTHCRFDSILYGCLLSIIIHSRKGSHFLKVSTSLVTFIAGILLLLFTLIYKDEFFRQTFRYSLQGIALLTIVTSILFNNRYHYLNQLLSTRPLVYIGKLSYSIYLFHFLADMIAEEYTKNDPLLKVMMITGITIVLSLCSYHLVEVPILKVRRNFGSHVSAKA